MVRRISGIEAFQAVDARQTRLRIVESEDLTEDARTLQQRDRPIPKPPLLLCIPGIIVAPESADRLFRNDQRRITKGQIVHLPAHRPPFDAERPTAETLVVALATLQRTVEEHDQRRTNKGAHRLPPHT